MYASCTVALLKLAKAPEDPAPGWSTVAPHHVTLSVRPTARRRAAAGEQLAPSLPMSKARRLAPRVEPRCSPEYRVTTRRRYAHQRVCAPRSPASDHTCVRALLFRSSGSLGQPDQTERERMDTLIPLVSSGKARPTPRRCSKKACGKVNPSLQGVHKGVHKQRGCCDDATTNAMSAIALITTSQRPSRCC
jgi:hypothetical protein